MGTRPPFDSSHGLNCKAVNAETCLGRGAQQAIGVPRHRNARTCFRLETTRIIDNPTKCYASGRVPRFRSQGHSSTIASKSCWRRERPSASPTFIAFPRFIPLDFERIVSAGLIPLTLAPFIGGSLNPLTDSLLGATVLIHSYIGFQACIVDYFPTYRVPKVQTALMWVPRFATLLTGIGFYEFETNDVGITEAIARI